MQGSLDRSPTALVSSLAAQVAREGTKKTVFTNFPELCRAMNRGQEHCMAFLLAVRYERVI